MKDPWDRLRQGMLPFHDHFRHQHAQIVSELPNSQHASKQELMYIMRTSLQLCGYLETHHRIEETYFFPMLATKQPEFAPNSQHTKEHEVMHAKLDELQAYSEQVIEHLQGAGKHKSGKGEDGGWPVEVYDAQKFEEIVSSLGQALFPHLTAEENSLSAESIRKAGYTLEDLRRIPL